MKLSRLHKIELKCHGESESLHTTNFLTPVPGEKKVEDFVILSQLKKNKRQKDERERKKSLTMRKTKRKVVVVSLCAHIAFRLHLQCFSGRKKCGKKQLKVSFGGDDSRSIFSATACVH